MIGKYRVIVAFLQYTLLRGYARSRAGDGICNWGKVWTGDAGDTIAGKS